MKLRLNILLRGLFVLLIVGQTSLGAVAMATEDPSPSPSPEVSASPTPSPEPSVSPSPDPSPSPSPEATASPSPSPTPSPSASPSPSPSPAAATTDKKDCPATGPCGTTGVIPTWVFNTGTQLWEKADKSSFVYDRTVGMWLSPKYYFDKQNYWYEIIPADQVASLPAGQYITAPNVVHTALGDVVVGSKDYELAKMMGLIPGGSDPTINSSGAGSTSQAGVTNSNQSWFDLTNLVSVINTLESSAKSGDVSATNNTQVGDAVTGAANVLANLINLLSSAWSWSNGSMGFFLQNLLGNLNGDITLSPNQTLTGGGGSLGGTSQINSSGPGSTNTADLTNTNGVNVNAQNTGNIVNNVDASATSGNATASENTGAGKVATGNATVEINIINLINSFINSGDSFFGILNIFGNFNGDVLFPEGFLNGALGSGPGGSNAGINASGPNSTNSAGVTNTDQTTVNNASSYGLANNVHAAAQSGTATAGGNTQVGNVATGNASTTGSNFNLVNSSIFGDNAVLVIVNVLGHWVGKIMTLPGGSNSTSGLLTGNALVNSSGAGSTNQANVSNTNTANINQTNNGSITNNINAQATSGDATADKNTSVGDVTTGDAKVSTGVSNIVNSVLNVKHWFGVLVINVFGSWIGDVGDNTSAGDAIATTGPTSFTGTTVGTGSSAQGQPTLAGTYRPQGATTVTTGATTATSQVLSATAQLTSHALEAAHTRNLNFVFWIAAILMALAGTMLGLERKLRS